MNDAKEFINSVLIDEDVDEKTSKFLLTYLSSWMGDTGLDINAETILMMNENKDLIRRLKVLYSNEKIIDTIERKIILSDIAKGKVTTEKPYKDNVLGIMYATCEPSFNERIAAINALNALDAIDDGNPIDRVIIVDNITEESTEYERPAELLEELDQ